MENQVTQLLKAMVNQTIQLVAMPLCRMEKLSVPMRLVSSTKSTINPSRRIVHLMYVRYLKSIVPYVLCS